MLTHDLLNFVTDLKRTVFCLQNGNSQGAETFLHHANSIYQKSLRGKDEVLNLKLSDTWKELFKTDNLFSAQEKDRYCDKLLTLASLLFLRSSTEFLSPALKKMDGSPNSARSRDISESPLLPTVPPSIKTKSL